MICLHESTIWSHCIPSTAITCQVISGSVVFDSDQTKQIIRDLSPLRSYRRARSPSPIRTTTRVRSPSPTRANITNDIRANRLITRYSTLFTHDRTAVADTLRRFVDEEEMVRRIICIATTEGTLSCLTCLINAR